MVSSNTLAHKLQFKGHLHVEVIEPDQVLLFFEKGCYLLTGVSFTKIAFLLKNGSYSEEEISNQLENEIPSEHVYYAFEKLKILDCIEPVNRLLPDSLANYCHLMNISQELAKNRLEKAKVFIGGPYSKRISDLLNSLTIQVVSDPMDANFGCILAEDYLSESIEKIARSFSYPWILVKPEGSEIWVGPLFTMQKAGCLRCLQKRVRQNRIEENFVKNKKGIQIPFVTSRGSLSTTIEMALNFTANEIFKWIVAQQSSLHNQMISIDTISSELQRHHLNPWSYCPNCGTQQTQEIGPLILQERSKEGSEDGGYRCIPPEETLKKYSHLVSPILGAVSSVYPARTNNSVIHVFGGGHNFSLSNSINGIYPKSIRSASGGKGKTESQAKASCLCEALERYSGVFQGNEPRISASYNQIIEDAVHPGQLFLFSEQQYRTRDTFNRHLNAIARHRIAEPICEVQEIEWTPVWSLTHSRTKYIPTAFCYFGVLNGFGSSNGCASGNCMEEAILQGFFELVERDATAIWWYNRLNCPGVDLNSFNEPYFQALQNEYRKIHREIWVLDITTDLQIPSFVAVSRRVDQGEEAIILGLGTHLEAKIAIARALTEMNQALSRVPLELFMNDKENSVAKNWLCNATAENQNYIKRTEIIKKANDYTNLKTSNLLEDIRHCQKVIEDKGMEMLVLDQTRPCIGLKVVRVVVPGLRHFYPRFAPGRLYDVPVEMGLLAIAKKEEEMNPIPMFM